MTIPSPHKYCSCNCPHQDLLVSSRHRFAVAAYTCSTVGVADDREGWNYSSRVVGILSEDGFAGSILTLDTDTGALTVILVRITRIDVCVRENTGYGTVVEDSELIIFEGAATRQVVGVVDRGSCTVDLVEDAFTITPGGVIVEVIKEGTCREWW